MAITPQQLLDDIQSSTKPTMHIRNFQSPHELASFTSDFVTINAQQAIKQHDLFSWALSGGSSPQVLYDEILKNPQQLFWPKIHVFWGDERMVPISSKHSNAGQAIRMFLSKTVLPKENIHPFNITAPTPQQAAQEYDELLHHFFTRHQLPFFDLLMLGMGHDGHTASLFHLQPDILNANRHVIATHAPSYAPIHERLSITFLAMMKAGIVCFLIIGRNKKKVLDEMSTDIKIAAQKYPAAYIASVRSTVWLTCTM